MKALEQRNSAFELMRLIAMFMIILGHCMLATAENVEPYGYGIDNIGWGIKAFTVCAVNLFFVLTGYFSVSSAFRISRIIRLWLKTLFYSIAICIIIALLFDNFSVLEVGYFFPILTKKYWFITTYIVVAFLAPYVSIMLEKLNNAQLNYLVVILLFFFSFHETFFKVAYTLDMTQGYGFIWACVMFCVGYWLHRHEAYIIRGRYWKYLCGYGVASLLIFISNLLIVTLGIAGGVESRGNFYAYNSLTVLGQSVCLFCVFIKYSQKMHCNVIINHMAKNSLAGYLISSHPILLIPLWTTYIGIDVLADNIPCYVFATILCSIIVLVICILIDKLLDKVLYLLGMQKALNAIDYAFDYRFYGKKQLRK